VKRDITSKSKEFENESMRTLSIRKWQPAQNKEKQEQAMLLAWLKPITGVVCRRSARSSVKRDSILNVAAYLQVIPQFEPIPKKIFLKFTE
jgi:hypothetical protein